MSSSESGFDRYGCTAADELGEWPDNAVAKAWTRGRCAGYQILLRNSSPVLVSVPPTGTLSENSEGDHGGHPCFCCTQAMRCAAGPDA